VKGFLKELAPDRTVILNLPSVVSQGDMQQHRTLIALHHPDQGGSSYIATKVNEARDYLFLSATQ
jgi:DnaJ family protein C protein 19